MHLLKKKKKRLKRVFWSFFWVRGYFGHFLGFGAIFVIFWVSGLFWSFYGFRGYFGHFLSFEGYFGHFLGFEGHFGHFLGFGGILVILRFWVFWSFLKILEYFSHFYFSGILVILIIE